MNKKTVSTVALGVLAAVAIVRLSYGEVVRQAPLVVSPITEIIRASVGAPDGRALGVVRVLGSSSTPSDLWAVQIEIAGILEPHGLLGIGTTTTTLEGLGTGAEVRSGEWILRATLSSTANPAALVPGDVALQIERQP